MLKKDEQVQHTVEPSCPAADDLISIHAALHAEMGYAFQVQVPDIINKRDHVLTIQATKNIQAGEMEVVRGASDAVIENFDEIGTEPCDCEICRSGRSHNEVEVSKG